jgi:hypothetical protein
VIDLPVATPARGWLAAAVLALAACSDGYPTEDAVPLDPAQMTRTELLAALNSLGDEPHLGKRWRFALRPDCELEVSVRNGDQERRRVALEGADLVTRSVDGVSEIRLLPRAGGEARAVTVFEPRGWSDIVRARALLTNLEQRCRAAPAPGA